MLCNFSATQYHYRMEGYCYRSDGRAIDKELTNRVFGLFTKWEEEEPEFDDLDSRQSLDAYLRQRLKQCLSEFKTDEWDDVRCVFNCMVNYCRFHNGGFLEHHPIPDVIGYRNSPGGNIKVPCGMEQVIHGLVQNFPPDIIKLLKVVDMIKWGDHDVQVLCKDGAEYLADHVICTMPLGYLKKYAHTTFNPILPKKKLDAIENIPFGKVNKIFLQWEKPFWKEGLGSIKLAWNDEEKTVKHPGEWYKKIFGFDEVLNNRNVLVTWISGDEAEYMEHLSDGEILQTCAGLIRRFLNDSSIPDPVKVTPTQWCTNQYILGSYSFRNFVVRSHHLADLREPVRQANVPKILFAGEATDSLGYSTLHGARDSGLREAERLIAHYGLKQRSQL